MTKSTEEALKAAYAARGGSRAVFSAKVADYLAARPGYPAALFDRLAALGALPARGRVADIGAGTGLLTAELLARGHAVVAVEPNAAMRAAADARLGALANYRSVAASAEATGLPDASIDLVTAAQAFHWFAVDAARTEFLRILAPAGQVALIWNDRDPDDPLQAEVRALFVRHGGAERHALAAHEDRSSVPEFFGRGPFQRIEVPHAQTLGRDGLIALVLSRSYMPPRDSPEGAAAAHDAGAVFDAHARDGAVALRYRTLVMVGRPAL
jgi:SAM-dependent methyltransferase